MNPPFFKRLFSWRVMRRCIFVLACLATLIGLFYAEENWRGKRAWEKCRRELEARGEVLDWNAYIPPTVPDEQNIFKAPKMTEWFVKSSFATAFSGVGTNAAKAEDPFALAWSRNTRNGPGPLAVVDVMPHGAQPPAGKAGGVWAYEDPASHGQAAKLLDDHIGLRLDSARVGIIVAKPVDTNHPLHLVLLADATPTVAGLTTFLSVTSGSTNQPGASGRGYLQVGPPRNNSFKVSLLADSFSAQDYLKASEPAVPNLDLVRKAVERPYARIEGDYERPFERPIPDFVRMRTVAQMLAQRAQCYLLLGQPEAAWHELAMVRQICRMYEAKPESGCPLLVEAMIDVAISGLYTGIVQDGLRLHAWREPELVALQEQLSQLNLLPLYVPSLRAERAAACRTFETTAPAEICRWFDLRGRKPNLWERLGNPVYLLLRFAPHGWVYLNMCTGRPGEGLTLNAFDVANNRISPAMIDQGGKDIEKAFHHWSPFSVLAAVTIPNISKATQTMARAQTLANEAYIACGLERYRLAKGQYPENLEALVPQFAEKLPHDIIGGGPLHYHRTDNGRFVLYSVGWNDKDDGGVAGKAIGEGDWVWE
jgi:hypothetical protein